VLAQPTQGSWSSWYQGAMSLRRSRRLRSGSHGFGAQSARQAKEPEMTTVKHLLQRAAPLLGTLAALAMMFADGGAKRW